MSEIITFLATVIAGLFTEAVGAGSHTSGCGIIAAIATIGAFILWSIRHKEQETLFQRGASRRWAAGRQVVQSCGIPGGPQRSRF